MLGSPRSAAFRLRLVALGVAPVLVATALLATAPAAAAKPGPHKKAAATASPTPSPTSSPTPSPTSSPTASPAADDAPAVGFTALRTASFATGFGEWDLGGPSVYPKPAATMTLDTGYDATGGARASIPGGAGNKYARTLWGNSSGQSGALHFGEGHDFTYGMALYLPVGFHASMQSYFVPMRWDNYGVQQVSRSGLAMYADGTMRLFRERSGVENQVNLLGGKTFRLSEGVWHWLEVRQKLSVHSGHALNEVLVDGVLVGSSTTANYYGEPVSAVRYGIVAISDSKQTLPLTVLYDRAVLGRGRLGPAS